MVCPPTTLRISCSPNAMAIPWPPSTRSLSRRPGRPGFRSSCRESCRLLRLAGLGHGAVRGAVRGVLGGEAGAVAAGALGFVEGGVDGEEQGVQVVAALGVGDRADGGGEVG